MAAGAELEKKTKFFNAREIIYLCHLSIMCSCALAL